MQHGPNTSVSEHSVAPALALGIDLRSGSLPDRSRCTRDGRKTAAAQDRPQRCGDRGSRRAFPPVGHRHRCSARAAGGPLLRRPHLRLCARFGILRAVDRACIAAGYRPYPTLLPSMVGLTLRGIALATRLIAAGERVVEAYPGMVQDILGIPRKRAGLTGLTQGLRGAGVRGIPRVRRVTHDELDAVTCALVGVLYLEGRTDTMGPGVPVPLVFPIASRARESGVLRPVASSRVPIAHA
jgi:predicted nuclease with RNAse H fold